MRNHETRQYHYFLSGFDIWRTGEDLNLTLKAFFKDTRGDLANIYRVPVPESSDYKIINFTPQVENAEFIDTAYKTKAAFKDAQS